MERVVALDFDQPPLAPNLEVNSDSPIDPLSNPDFLPYLHYHPDDDCVAARSELISLKSSLVLHMLDRKMGKGHLQKVINKIMVSAISNDLTAGISTQFFLRLCRKVSGKVELKSFSEQWIYGSGTPRFSFSYNFSRKKMMIEFKFQQRAWTGPSKFKVRKSG